MISFDDIIQRCHERRKKPLLQRKTVVTPALYNKGFPYHLTTHCAYKYPVLLVNLEEAHVSFMPIGRAPGNDNGPRELGGERFLKHQGINDWDMRQWHESWGIQVYTGTPSELDKASWHDFHFTYNLICSKPDDFHTCIDTLVNAVPNPLLTITKSGGIRFSCRIPDYLHPNTDTSKLYIHKHTPTSEDPDKLDVLLEIYADKNYSRWDARYEIVQGNLLDPPIIAKEVVFAPIDALRVLLHEPTPQKTVENTMAPEIPASLGSQNLDLAKDTLIKKGFSYIGQEENTYRWTLPHSEINNHYISLWEDEETVWIRASNHEIGIPITSTPITDIWVDIGIVPLKSPVNIPISDKVHNIREGKLSPLAIKRPYPVLQKPEQTSQMNDTHNNENLQKQKILNQTDHILGLITEQKTEVKFDVKTYISSSESTCLNVPTYKFAEKLENHYQNQKLTLFERCKPRMYLWEQVKQIPIDVRMTNPFQLGNVCEDPEKCDALEEKGGNASETICPQCPVYTDCQQRGFLSQPASLNRAKTQILALPELFFDPHYTETADEILKQMDDTERLCILDRIQAYKLFPECKLTKQVLQEWSVNWQGCALGDFAKALLHAVEIKDIPHADAVKRIRAVIRAFEWQHRKLIRQVAQVIVWGKVVPRGYVDPNTGTQLARFSIKFEGGASAYVPHNNKTSKILTKKGINVFKVSTSAINEDMRIRMSITKAIQLGIFNIDTVEDIQKLQTINSNPNWTFWHQLDSFFTHYTRDADAPIRWNGKTLRFWVPPVLHPTVKKLMLKSVTLSDQHLQRAFPNKNIEVRYTEPTPWLPGNKVFQIRTGYYPQDTILDYNSNWDLIGLSETAKRFFHGICTEIDRNPNSKHTILTYKAIAARLSDLEKKENVCSVTHFDLLRGVKSTLEESHVVWVIGTPALSEKVIWRRAQILFGNDEEPLSYEKDTKSEQYIDERVQSVYEQSAIPKLSRIVHLTKLNEYPNKKVVMISSMVLPQITDRPETLFFDWKDFEVAGGLEKLPDVIATREQFETERNNLTGESEREHVEHILGCSSRQANRILKKLRGGRPLRIPFKEQIITLLSDGDKRTAEFIEAIEGHPKAIKNELGRLVDIGEIVKVRWGVYTLPQ